MPLKSIIQKKEKDELKEGEQIVDKDIDRPKSRITNRAIQTLLKLYSFWPLFNF